MWRYRDQLIRHIQRCTFVQYQSGLNEVLCSQRPLVQVVGAEVFEPVWRILNPPDVVIYPYNVMPYFCPSGPGLRALVVHDLMFLSNKFGLSSGTLYRRAKFRRSVLNADVVICISETTKRDLLAKWPHLRIVKIPCALDLAFVEPFEKPVLSGNRFRILHFGGAVKSKATGLLLRAVAQVISEGNMIELLIASMSKHRRYVKEQADACRLDPEHYSVLPRLSDLELVKLFRTCNLHCMPSLGEGFGMPVIEAASQGVVNLLSPLPVFREIMSDAALYFDDWTVESVAEGLKTAITSDLSAMIQIARLRALAYSFETVHSTHAKPFFEALTKGIRPPSE